MNVPRVGDRSTTQTPEHGSSVSSAQIAIDARDIVRVYGATTALAGASLRVRTGEIHGLLGANGAGKSTLVRVLAGIEPRDLGELEILGRSLPRRVSPREIAQSGVAFIHQDLGLINDMSVTENIALGTGYTTRHGLIDYRRARERAAEALERVGVASFDLGTKVGSLPLASRTLVAIAAALATDARVIVMDEPTAALQGGEVNILFSRLAALAQADVACVLISHRMDEVLRICDRVTVFRDGVDVGTRTIEATNRRELVSLIVGEDSDDRGDAASAHLSPPTARGEPAMALISACGDNVGPLNMEIRAGEITAITGLADSGHLSVPRQMCGLEPITEGSIMLNGRPFNPTSISACLAAGIAYVPPDRLADGIAPGLTILENFYLNPRRAWWKPASNAKSRRSCEKELAALSVTPPDPLRAIGTLSGGNQQKVLLGRSMIHRPRILVCCEPTAGVDVGAKRQIHALLRRECRANAMAVVLVSSDFEEVAEMSDRAYIMARGRQVAELDATQLSTATVTARAFG